jgi:protein phosphatase
MRLKFGAATDVGMVRQSNEDAFSAEGELFIVADGMGGHNAGEVASALAVTTMKSGARNGLTEPSQFRELVQQANTAIYTASLDDSAQAGMGTTVTALAVLPGEEPRVMVANVGDSRTYVWRNGRLDRISIDHSYVQELVNEVTRALGIDRSVQVDVFTYDVRTGDRLVLCSDGLVDEVSDTEISKVIGQHSNAQECAEALIMVANTNGGRDNTTVVVVDIADDISEPVAVVPDNDDTQQIESVPPVLVKEKRRITVGMTLFWSALVIIVLGVVVIMGVYGRSGYYLDFTKDDTVAVYRGRVGGVLWFDPTIDTETELKGDDLPPDILRDVMTNREFASSSQARKFLSLVQQVILNSTTTTVPTTTTTVG